MKKDMENELYKLDEEIIAVHEAGHAIVNRILLPQCEIKKISCKCNFFYKGYVRIQDHSINENDKEMLYKIDCLLAGGMAEKIIFGIITKGNKKDISSVCNMIEQFLIQEEYTERALCIELIKMINCEMQKTKKILEEHKNELKMFADFLLKKKVLKQKQIEDFFLEIGI